MCVIDDMANQRYKHDFNKFVQMIQSSAMSG